MTKQDGSRSGVHEETQLFFIDGHGLLTTNKAKMRIADIRTIKANMYEIIMGKLLL